jgi:hypothetical protein
MFAFGAARVQRDFPLAEISKAEWDSVHDPWTRPPEKGLGLAPGVLSTLQEQ